MFKVSKKVATQNFMLMSKSLEKVAENSTLKSYMPKTPYLRSVITFLQSFQRFSNQYKTLLFFIYAPTKYFQEIFVDRILTFGEI